MSSTIQTYNWIEIDGPSGVVPVNAQELKGESLMIYILMGPTGSGKSAFVEALSPDYELSISKNTLDSVTQDVTCYRVLNLTNPFSRSYILVDTPGFLDTKLSESRITRMITDLLGILRQSAPHTYVSVFTLYFQPITDIRMGGTRRDAVRLLKGFTKSFNAQGIKVVTTMWNHLSTPKQIEDANRRFNLLKDEIYAPSDTMHIVVAKFKFSKDSALSTLDVPAIGWGFGQYRPQNVTEPEYQSLIQTKLLERIINSLQWLHILAEDKREATAPGREDPLLLEVVVGDEKAALAALQSFLDDLDDIGPDRLEALHVLLDQRYDVDASVCSSLWPHLRHVRPQSSSRPPRHFSPSRIKNAISHMKRLFRKKD